jgi:hypothetical protein
LYASRKRLIQLSSWILSPECKCAVITYSSVSMYVAVETALSLWPMTELLDNSCAETGTQHFGHGPNHDRFVPKNRGDCAEGIGRGTGNADEDRYVDVSV